MLQESVMKHDMSAKQNLVEEFILMAVRPGGQKMTRAVNYAIQHPGSEKTYINEAKPTIARMLLEAPDDAEISIEYVFSSQTRPLQQFQASMVLKDALGIVDSTLYGDELAFGNNQTTGIKFKAGDFKKVDLEAVNAQLAKVNKETVYDVTAQFQEPEILAELLKTIVKQK